MRSVIADTSATPNLTTILSKIIEHEQTKKQFTRRATSWISNG
jgi:hypothetical protein